MKHKTLNKELIGNNVWLVEIGFQPENDLERNAIESYGAGTASNTEKDMLDNSLNQALGNMSAVQFVKQEGNLFIVTATM
jgi:hypothetical protein